MLEIEEQYTRKEIAAELGGSAIEYLPQVNGKVVCACLRQDYNPKVPMVILAGLGPRVRKWAEILCTQNGAIPVFVKQKPNKWKYTGNFKVEKFSTNVQEIKEQEKDSGRTGRNGISRIIYLREISRN
jgi:hypothetical protein